VLDERLALVVLHVARLAYGMPRPARSPSDVALADEAVEREVRGVALQAGAGLLLLGHAPVCSWSKSA
jgi:hypothetical protein